MPVAIKLLRGYDPSHARRLKFEARAAARLAHPAIVRTLDVATTEQGEPFIVMELLNGETLSSALLRGHVSALRAVQLLLPIAEALSFAHEHGVVHRDLKPENVFLAVEGDVLRPKLLDFGIAKLTDSAAAIRLTASGIALGSPSYMSPEQARGEEVDHLSDVWSFCVLLYKAIGGKAPFRGPSARDILEAILQHPAPPLPLGAGVDGHLAAIVLSGLHKDPVARPQSMRKLGQQLARWLLLHGVAVDASGAPLVDRWLSDAPAKPRASDAPPRLRPRAAPGVEATAPSSARKRQAVRPTRRSWTLWALAGVLVAGAAVGLTKAGGSRRSVAAAPANPVVQEARAVDVAVTHPELRAIEPEPEQPLAVSDGDTSADGDVQVNAAPEAPSPPTVQNSTSSRSPRAKSSAPASRPALPF